jgi:hypothetical protein
MAFDCRRMRLFQGRVWTQTEWDAYQEEERKKRPPMSKRESQLFLTSVLGMVAGMSMSRPRPQPLPRSLEDLER